MADLLYTMGLSKWAFAGGPRHSLDNRGGRATSMNIQVLESMNRPVGTGLIGVGG